MGPRIPVFFTFLITLHVGGCAIGYYAQALRGQMELSSRSEPIEDLLEDDALPEELRMRLELILEIRRFASNELQLPDNDSYRKYADLGRPYVVWNIFAAQEFSVEPKTWCFPIVGCVGYRGYFKEEKAGAYAARLADDGFDVYVGGVAAYSTLGRFDDPVLNTMLHWSDERLAGIIFHELAHQVLYVKGDSAFSEAFATAVEEIGVRLWIDRNGTQADLSRYYRARKYRSAFGRLVNQTRGQLRELYARELSDTEKRESKRLIFAGMKDQYVRMREAWEGYNGYDAWFARELNNAHLASVATYRQYLPAFRLMFVRAGRDLTAFYDDVRELSERSKSDREVYIRELLAIAQSEPLTQ
ncbi:MAG: aminopeptidase [Gammaproteobacteria bacterium]